MENILSVLEKLGSGVLALLAVIGCADLAKTLLSRFFSKKDKQKEVEVSNLGKQLEADEKFTETILKRLDKLEAEFVESEFLVKGAALREQVKTTLAQRTPGAPDGSPAAPGTAAPAAAGAAAGAATTGAVVTPPAPPTKPVVEAKPPAQPPQ